MSTPSQRIEELRKELNRHNHNYYVLNQPEISDYDFDMMMKELEKLEEQYPELDDPLSPTHRVGSDINHSFTQVAHRRPMLSLSNCYSIGEVDEWLRRINDALMGTPCEIIGEMKFDGTSISLTYEHGRLTRAVTRGDGSRGDDVTNNIITIRSIPLQLNGTGWPEEFEIRGEILLPWKEFDRLNAERAFNEEPLFANPRNAAAGTLKMQNSAEVAKRGLDAVFYYLLGDNLPYDNHYDNMIAAREWGFKVPHQMTRLHSIEDVDRFIEHWDEARKQLPIATDGLVFKVNNLQQQLNLGYTAKSPRWAVAYKFKAERQLTRLRYVSFEVGRMGIVTPVANLEPVLLSGTVVKRASLHNEDIIAKLGIHEHDMLYVEKGGEIIPKITGVDESGRQPDALPVKFVDKCPVCGTPLTRVEGEATWICSNRLGCPPQIAGRIEHFVGRHMMNIDGIGEELSVLLYEGGWVKDPADLYDLHTHRDELLGLPGMGEKSIDRMLQGIESSKQVPFDRVLYALSILFVGETVAKKLAYAMRDIDSIMHADTATLCAIDDIGPRIAQSVVDYFNTPVNRYMVERLRAAGVQMALAETAHTRRSDKLQGKSIVISGTFKHHSRDQYKEMIEINGGKNAGSVSKKTDFILAGDNMGPAKLEKAHKLGVRLLTEDEFLDMIKQDI